MSRNATSLLVAPPLSDLAGGVEVFIVETRLSHPDPTGAEASVVEHGLCIALLVNPDESNRRLLRVEAARYVGALVHIHFVAGRDWGSQLVGLLQSFESAFLELVVGVPHHDREALDQVISVVESLKRTGRHQLGLGVVVAAQPPNGIGSLHDLRLVAPEGMSAQEAAIWLHAAIAQLAAPQMIECVTAQHVDDWLAAASSPARFVLTDLEHLQVPFGHPVQEVQTGTRVAAFLLDGVGLRRYSAAIRSLRTNGIADPLVCAANGLTAPVRFGASVRCVLVISSDEVLSESG